MPSNLAILKRTILGGRFAHEFLLALAVGVLGDHFAGHRRMLLIGDGVDGEKLNLLVVQAIVPVSAAICSSE